MSWPAKSFLCKSRTLLVLVFCILPFSLSAQSREVSLVHLATVEGRAISAAAKIVLERDLGMRVELQETDAKAAFTAVAGGKADCFLEAHLPAMHKEYFYKNRTKISDYGCIYRGVKSGLIVPSYVDINKISELKNSAGRFNKAIFGLESDTVNTGLVEQTVIPRYHLDFELDVSSELNMQAAVRMAIDAGDWVVFIGTSPHWMFAKWNLKFLRQDLDKLVWQQDDIRIIGGKDLASDNPDLARFLGNFSFTEEEMSDLLLKVWESTVTVDMAVQQWLGFHEELAQGWLR